jgi:hypothetical protein
MNREMIKASFTSAIYFSCVSFVIIWLAEWLYGFLEKTPGRLDIGWVIIIVLSLMLILFFLSMMHIFLGAHAHAKVKLSDKLIGLAVFILLSIVLIVGLGFLFWFPIG